MPAPAETNKNDGPSIGNDKALAPIELKNLFTAWLDNIGLAVASLFYQRQNQQTILEGNTIGNVGPFQNVFLVAVKENHENHLPGALMHGVTCTKMTRAV